uniref:Uncharacterized protein n=1 Tax=Arundo donax TaxID=35708 RepID=A0A0A8YVI9_ARUDO
MDNSSRAEREYPWHKVARSGQFEIINFERDRPGNDDELVPELTNNGGSGIARRPAFSISTCRMLIGTFGSCFNSLQSRTTSVSSRGNKFSPSNPTHSVHIGMSSISSTLSDCSP